jgi:primosomal protein N' (replication factor Y)
MPSVELVDMRAVRKITKHAVFSPRLLDAISHRIERGEGALVFLNRRGFSSQIQCEECGDVPMCPNCDVALTYHKSGSALKCHYCGFSEPMRTSCHVCGSTELRDTGLGTQQVEEGLVAALQERSVTARIERMDTDTTSRRGAHKSILRRFNDGEIDVLVGTQMIAKGLDIPRVTLVGVVNADQQLYRTDFRAAERTVQLLVQVSGRAGRRRDHPGEVIIQTSAPDHPALIATQSQRLAGWIDEELELRRAAGYPPYARFHVIEFSGVDEHNIDVHARILEKLLPERTEYMERLPAVAPPIPRLRNRYRRVIVIKNDRSTDPSGHRCRDTIRRAVDSYQSDYATSAVRVTIDIDASGSL